MAAIWTVKIDVTHAPDKIGNVTGTRTDGVDVRTYSLSSVQFVQAGKTAAEIRAQVTTDLFAQYTAAKAKDALVAVVTAQEALLATTLNGKEV